MTGVKPSADLTQAHAPGSIPSIRHYIGPAPPKGTGPHRYGTSMIYGVHELC